MNLEVLKSELEMGWGPNSEQACPAWSRSGINPLYLVIYVVVANAKSRWGIDIIGGRVGRWPLCLMRLEGGGSYLKFYLSSFTNQYSHVDLVYCSRVLS